MTFKGNHPIYYALVSQMLHVWNTHLHEVSKTATFVGKLLGKYPDWTIIMEPKNGGWKMIFLFNWDIG